MPGAKGIILTGSLARGFSDYYSDFDAGILCSRLPHFKTRDKFLKQVCDKDRGSGHSGYLAWLHINGIIGHIVFFKMQDQKKYFQSLKKGNTSVPLWTDMPSIKKWQLALPAHVWLEGKFLYDPENMMRAFKEKAKDYPAKFKQAIHSQEKKYLNDCLGNLKMATALNDSILFYLESTAVICSLYRILNNINEKHMDMVDTKWADRMIKRLPEKSPNCLKRIHSCFTGLSEKNINQKYKILIGLYQDISRYI